MYYERIVVKPCPDGIRHHQLVEADDTTTTALGLPPGALLHVDRARAPTNGDVVLAELVVRDRLTMSVRRFTLAEGMVSLARPGDRPGSLVRPAYEVHVLGVVDGHVAPLSRS